MLLQELEERYNRLRLECQLAVDKAEDVTEAELVRRVLSKEKRNALSKGFFGAAPNRYACCCLTRLSQNSGFCRLHSLQHAVVALNEATCNSAQGLLSKSGLSQAFSNGVVPHWRIAGHAVDC